MAGISSIYAVGAGLAQALSRAHQLSSISSTSCKFLSVGTTEFKKLDGKETTCSIFLYQVTHNQHTRNSTARNSKNTLFVDLHLILTIWADTALAEHTLLAWVMRELYLHSVLDRSILDASGQFTLAERLQFVPEDISIDDLTKIWQVLTPPYRPSMTYVVRNVRIDPDQIETFEPVVATRYTLQEFDAA